jgi:hypothetical protein
LRLDRQLLNERAMRSPPTYMIELSLDDEEEEPTASVGLFAWGDEKTARLDFDKPVLTPDDRLIVGYLTMEEHGMFAELSADEQQRVVRMLRR